MVIINEGFPACELKGGQAREAEFDEGQLIVRQRTLGPRTGIRSGL